MLHPSSLKNIPPHIHAVAIANLDDLYKKAKKAWEKGDRNEDPNIKKINRLVAPLYIDNEGYLVLITEKVFSNPQSIGLYTVEEIDIKKESDGLTKVADADKIDLMAFPLSNSVSNILQQLELVNQNTTICCITSRKREVVL